MSNLITSRDLTRLSGEKRRSNAVPGAPRSFDKQARTVDAVLSTGSPVRRSFGVERLKISAAAVDLSRLTKGGIMCLDSHVQGTIASSLGRVTSAWFESSSLLGRIRFNKTDEGERAFGMVQRGEITSVSIGYTIDRFSIIDAAGNILDPAVDLIRWDDELTFEATKWSLLECSVVSVPADPEATFRSFDSSATSPFIGAKAARNIKTRMRMRMRRE
jgi:phage head maturation protease